MSPTSTTRWNPDLIDELVLHGFDRDALVADDPRTSTRHDNPRFRYISATPVKTSGVNYHLRPDSRDGTRIKVFVRDIKYPYERVAGKLRPLVICTANPRWKKSLTRWMTTTVMHLTEEVWQKEDIEKAGEQRKEQQRDNTLSALLDEFAIAPTPFKSHFRVSWDWDWQKFSDSPASVGCVLPFSINPKRHNWDGDTQVKKIGRLMLFLHQEKWINLDEIKGDQL